MNLKIFVYKINTGELVKEYLYNDFLFVFNNVISYNHIYENDKNNIIVATEWPPNDLKYKNKEWLTKKKASKKEYQKLIKFFD